MTNLKEAEGVCRSLSQAVSHGIGNLEAVPLLVKRILGEGLWRKRQTQVGVVEHSDFRAFLMTPPLEGLGMKDPEALVDICRRFEDREAEALLVAALKGKQGQRTDLVAISNKVERATGTERSYALRRLAKDRPDLHAQVVAGEASPHAAMVEAGFRVKTFTVPLDVDRAAAALHRYFTTGQLAKLRALL